MITMTTMTQLFTCALTWAMEAADEALPTCKMVVFRSLRLQAIPSLDSQLWRLT